MSILRNAYSGLSWLSTPFVYGYINWRASKGREDKNRLQERKGIASLPRPPKPLLWIHAVSVGEAMAALTIIQAVVKQYPGIHVLLTTMTVSSARVIQKRLPRNVIHQYCPVDTPGAVKKFLDHWQPNLAIWIESELWPNLIYQTQDRGIPTLLLNGRMSLKSFSTWKKLKGVISPLLKHLSLCAVQSEDQAAIFKALGAEDVTLLGNVKGMMTPLEVDSAAYASLKQDIAGRPVWVAASTHPGEDSIIFKTHKILRKTHPTLLTILVPRHVERANTLEQLALQEGLTVTRRTRAPCLKEIELYIGDTLGEMALYYAIAPVVVMGATFVPKGGHNPIEAAQCGAFVLHGPHTFNNPQLYALLADLNLSRLIQREDDLAVSLLPWLNIKKEGYEEPHALETYREEGLQRLRELLMPYLQTLKDERG